MIEKEERNSMKNKEGKRRLSVEHIPAIKKKISMSMSFCSRENFNGGVLVPLNMVEKVGRVLFDLFLFLA